ERASQLPANVDLGALGKTMLQAAEAARIGVTVTVVDPAGLHNIYVSEAASEIMGWSVEELVRRDPMSFIVAEDLPRLNDRLAKRALGEKGQKSYEVTVLRKDGRRVSLEVTASDALIGGRRAVFAFIVDVSARKAAEDARLRSEARFRELIESAPEPIGIIREDHFAYVNRAFIRVLGYPSAHELYTTPLVKLVHPDEAPLLLSRARRIIHDDDRLAPQTYRAVRHDGSFVLLEMSSVPFDYEGKPSILSMGRDVTARKTLEAQLVQADRLAALGTMAAGVAHEINNPLAYLILNLDWIARKLKEGPRDDQSVEALVEMLREARSGAERVAAIVRELRSFSRADGDTRRCVDVETVVRSAIKMAAHEIRYRARIVTSFEPVLPVWANEARLEQVVLNLLLNAAQAMEEAKAETNVIRVEVRDDGGERAVLEVLDNGPGIAPEVLPRIFDPFFTTRPNGGGTGLGLSICHGIVASLGGQITVHSEPGAGATFRVVLPTTTESDEVEAGVVANAQPPPSGVRARVLVVDDELPIANTMRDLLGVEHQVVAATSAREALATLRSEPEFDVVFCDLMMPEMSGMEFYEQLRREYPGIERRIVFMTGGAFTPRAAEFLASVDNLRLEKPFSLGVVEAIVRDMATASRRSGE
ncbi:MAG TPA: PAS domain S-box protein, partial [Polyangiaceae bacterium]|nr:PAS domain S-box protein [Polyangiaceae bacterium]